MRLWWKQLTAAFFLWTLLPECRATTRAERYRLKRRQTSSLESSVEVQKYGIHISVPECNDFDEKGEYDAILREEKQPYVITGPPEECTASGCTHGFWGSRCRWKGEVTSSCPAEDKANLTTWLADYARQGARWAKEVLLLRPCKFFNLIQGRTVWFIGDGNMQEMAFAAACLLVEYFQSDLELPVFPDDKAFKQFEKDEFGGEVYNWCHALEEETRICRLGADTGTTIAKLLELAPKFINAEDVVIINFGHTLFDGDVYQHELNVFAKTFAQHEEGLPRRLFWRETSPQHFATPTGQYDLLKGHKDQRCNPPGEEYGESIKLHTNGHLDMTNPKSWMLQDLKSVVMGGFRNHMANPVMEDLGIEIVYAYNYTLPLWQYHHHYHLPTDFNICATTDCDCTHVCSPSWYQIWLGSLQSLLEDIEAEDHRPRAEA